MSESKVDNLMPIAPKIKPLEVKTDHLELVKIYIKPGLELSITDLMEVVDFVTALANAIAKFTIGGANLFTGLVAFVPVVPKAIKAVSGLNNIPAELKYMTPAQKTQLIEVIKLNLTFSEDVERIIGIALDIAFGIKTILSIFKKSE